MHFEKLSGEPLAYNLWVFPKVDFCSYHYRTYIHVVQTISHALFLECARSLLQKTGLMYLLHEVQYPHTVIGFVMSIKIACTLILVN
jgi:tRNA1(Val) A37 N6-methylase TrmN6